MGRLFYRARIILDIILYSMLLCIRLELPKGETSMKVRVIIQHGLKAAGFFEKCKGKEFGVLWKREGGYDVDLTPIGHPGTWGYMYDDEVEEVDQSEDLVGVLAEQGYNVLRNWIKTNLLYMGKRNSDGSFVIEEEDMNRLLDQINVCYANLLDESKEVYRRRAGPLRKITDIFKTAG